jgi:hypothetical protein
MILGTAQRRRFGQVEPSVWDVANGMVAASNPGPTLNFTNAVTGQLTPDQVQFLQAQGDAEIAQVQANADYYYGVGSPPSLAVADVVPGQIDAYNASVAAANPAPFSLANLFSPAGGSTSPWLWIALAAVGVWAVSR